MNYLDFTQAFHMRDDFIELANKLIIPDERMNWMDRLFPGVFLNYGKNKNELDFRVLIALLSLSHSMKNDKQFLDFLIQDRYVS